MRYVLIPITAIFHDTIKRDPQAASLIRFLAVLLPPMLRLRFDRDFNNKAYISLLKKEFYDDLLENFVLTLKDMKCTGIKQLPVLLKRSSKLKNDLSVYEKLAEILVKNKQRIQRAIPNSMRDFNRLVSLYNAKDLKPTNLKAINEISSQVDNIVIKRLLRTMDGFGAEASKESYKDALDEYHAFIRKNFKQKPGKNLTMPTTEQLDKLKERKPEKFAEYKALVNAAKKHSKTLLEDIWVERGLPKIVDAPIIKELLAELNIRDTIDDGFVGKIGLVPTGNVLFSYWTKYGKELANVPGHDVKMNPAYTKADTTYYCTGYPQFSNGEEKYFYTKDFSISKLQSKHESVNLVTDDLLSDARKEYTDTYKLITKKHELTSTTIAALVVAVIDDTAGRIGGSGSSEENGVYGIRILLAKHCTIQKDGSVKLSYVGKKKVKQTHIITDKGICAALKYLKSIRKPSEYLFSKNGDVPVSAQYINKYINKTLKLPISAHGFRKLHANRIFNEVVSANKKKIKAKPLDVFNDAVGAVAKKLGHEPINSIKSYIDPVLIRNYFDNAGIQPPKKVQNVLDDMLNNTSDNTEE